MGTNYYIKTLCPNPCEHCLPPELHIGKSSAGWRFLANADDMGTTEWPVLRDRLLASTIEDEYGDLVDGGDLVATIEAKSETESHVWPVERRGGRWHYPDGPVDFTEGGFS